MNNIKLFVHGVPVGHEMYGCDTKDENDYLKQFYDLKLDSSFALVIDIVDGTSYYTYVRKNNFSNCEGRPNSYFGITISFGKKLCDNVYMLYKILDSIYKQVIVGGGIINESKTGASFAVRQIEGTTIKNTDIIAVLKNIAIKNIDQHIGDSFTPIEKSVTTRGKAQFNLEEVDSPAFRESVLSKQVYVSSEFKSNTKALMDMEQKFHPLETEKNQLLKENDSYKEKVAQLESEITRLTTEHANAEGKASKKYKEKIEELESQLQTLKAKNLDYKKIIDEACENIDLIDVPSQKLMRLLASRFREENKKGDNKDIKAHKETRSSNKEIAWHQICNTILLCAVLIVSVITLCRSCNFIGGNSTTETTIAAKEAEEVAEDTTSVVGDNVERREDVPAPEPEPVPAPITYDKVSDCRINIVGGSDNLDKNKVYTLNLKKADGKPANVPDGDWIIEPASLLIISKNSFSIPEEVQGGTNIQITYVSSDDPSDKKIRTVKVK